MFVYGDMFAVDSYYSCDTASFNAFIFASVSKNSFL